MAAARAAEVPYSVCGSTRMAPDVAAPIASRRTSKGLSDSCQPRSVARTRTLRRTRSISNDGVTRTGSPTTGIARAMSRSLRSMAVPVRYAKLVVPLVTKAQAAPASRARARTRSRRAAKVESDSGASGVRGVSGSEGDSGAGAEGPSVTARGAQAHATVDARACTK